MIETYFEQNVSVDDEGRNKIKKQILTILKYINLVLGVVAFMLMFYVIVDEEGNLIHFMWIIFAISIPAAFIFSYFLLRKMVSNINPEFDYVLNGGKLFIVRIIRRVKRKLFLELNVSEFDQIGKITLPSFDNAMRNNPKVYSACANPQNEDFYYLITRHNGERCVVYLEFNDGMLNAITRTLGRNIVTKK